MCPSVYLLNNDLCPESSGTVGFGAESSFFGEVSSDYGDSKLVKVLRVSNNGTPRHREDVCIQGSGTTVERGRKKVRDGDVEQSPLTCCNDAAAPALGSQAARSAWCAQDWPPTHNLSQAWSHVSSPRIQDDPPSVM